MYKYLINRQKACILTQKVEKSKQLAENKI